MGIFSNLAGGGVLFAAALLLMTAELFFPSHGILSVLAACFALAGVVVTYMASPPVGILSGVALLIAAPFAIYWAVRLYPSTIVGKRVLLQPPTPRGGTGSEGYEALADNLSALTGKRGVALTNLRPAGMCDIEGRRVDSMSESTIIAAGAHVEVVRVVGLRVIVREVAADGAAADA